MRHAALAAAVILFAVACSSPPEAVATGEGWRAELTWTTRPAALRPVTLRLKLIDASGRPLAIGALSAMATMPEMEHGGETVAFVPVGDGIFEAVHTFSMDGRWTLHAEWTSDGRVHRTEFRIEVGAH
ncbi:MAG: FixH family protein [Armatimonadota bacterium]|nr:FixH family protein [Armatimonadota bacterium]MDR5697868.1 FixH family protein [Armatimonadota bacterium]